MKVDEEARAILNLVSGDLSRAVQILQHQHDVLYSRAQVLTGLAGMVVTVTGFSGRLIASTNRPAQYLVILGLAIVLCSAVFVIRRVMKIRWVTSDLSDDHVASIKQVLLRRDRKTKAIRTGGLMLFIGLLCFFTAFALMLTHPAPVNLPLR